VTRYSATLITDNACSRSVFKVVDILDPDRQAQEVVAHPERAALFRRNRGMRHDCRMLDQTVRPAEALCKREQPDSFEDTPAAG